MRNPEIKDINRLRKETGFSVKLCQKALLESENYDEAKKLVTKKARQMGAKVMDHSKVELPKD